MAHEAETNETLRKLYDLYPTLAERWTPEDLLPKGEDERAKSYLICVEKWLDKKPVMEKGYAAKVEECARQFAEKNMNVKADDFTVKLAAGFMVSEHIIYFPAKQRMEEAMEKKSGVFRHCKDAYDVTYKESCLIQNAGEGMEDIASFIPLKRLLWKDGFVHRFSEHQLYNEWREEIGNLVERMRVDDCDYHEIQIWCLYEEEESEYLENGTTESEGDEESGKGAGTEDEEENSENDEDDEEPETEDEEENKEREPEAKRQKSTPSE